MQSQATQHREPWNKGKLIGQKPALKSKDIWAIRIELQKAHQVRNLAMFSLAIDSKLRGCGLVNLRVRNITHGNQILARAMVVQRKTQRPVQFELTEPTRTPVSAWIAKVKLRPEDHHGREVDASFGEPIEATSADVGFGLLVKIPANLSSGRRSARKLLAMPSSAARKSL
jgi:hypothetical protein